MTPTTGRARATGEYPPSVYAVADNRRIVPPASLLWWAGATVLLGAVLGVIWWLVAPGGALYGDEQLPETWLFRDLTLAVLEIAVGAAIGTVLVAKLELPDAVRRVAVGLGGSVMGSLLAAVTGNALGRFLGPHGTAELPGAEFMLRSWGVVALWPAVAASIVFMATVLAWANAPARRRR